MSTQGGGWRWVLGKGRAVEWDAEGRPTRLIGLNLDIHKLKEAQEARRKSEAPVSPRVLSSTAMVTLRPRALPSTPAQALALASALAFGCG